MNFDITKARVFTVDPNEIEFHRLSEANPLMNTVQYNELRDDIEARGQLFPVILYRKKIIDGRHRTLALRELGSSTMRAISLPNNYSVKAAMEIVSSVEKRRHQGVATKAIKGWKIWKEDGSMNRVEAANHVGVDPKELSAANYIAKHADEDILTMIWDGESYKLSNGGYTRSLQTIERDIKKTAKNRMGRVEDEVERDAIYLAVIKLYNEAMTGTQDSIYEAIRAIRASA